MAIKGFYEFELTIKTEVMYPNNGLELELSILSVALPKIKAQSISPLAFLGGGRTNVVLPSLLLPSLPSLSFLPQPTQPPQDFTFTAQAAPIQQPNVEEDEILAIMMNLKLNETPLSAVSETRSMSSSSPVAAPPSSANKEKPNKTN